jgi:hypothetical protein
VRMPKTLSAEPGMHRWVWDLHYPTPSVTDHEYPISAIYHDTPRYPLGPSVLPGTYTVKLTVGGKTLSQPLTIKMDPRVKASTADLAQQFQLETKVAELANRDYDALQQVRSVRGQLQARLGSSHSLPPALSQALHDVDQKAAALDGTGGRAQARMGGGGENLATANSNLASLLTAVDSTDAVPTTQQVTAVNDLQQSVDRLLAQWTAITTKDVPALNEQLKGSGLPPIDLKAAPASDTVTGAAADED